MQAARPLPQAHGTTGDPGPGVPAQARLLTFFLDQAGNANAAASRASRISSAAAAGSAASSSGGGTGGTGHEYTAPNSMSASTNACGQQGHSVATAMGQSAGWGNKRAGRVMGAAGTHCLCIQAL
jgi:hypothetical protein